jgi:hypothetical protein
MPSERQYAPLQPWKCYKCGAGGDLAIPPASYGVDTLGLAERAHQVAKPDCHNEWGIAGLAVTQGAAEYPD